MEEKQTFCQKLWVLFEFWFKKFIEYRFRNRSIFKASIKYFSFGLIVELGKLGSQYAFDDIYILIANKWGVDAVLYWRIVLDGIFGGFTIGYHWVSIIIKLFLVIFFAILEWKKDNDVKINITIFFSNFVFWNWNWKVVFKPEFNLSLIKIINIRGNQFSVTPDWFDSIESRQLGAIEKTKFNEKLHFPSDVERDILEQINSKVDTELILKHIISLNKLNLTISYQLVEIENIEKRSVTYKINAHSEIYLELKRQQLSYSENQEKINSILKKWKTEQLDAINSIADETFFTQNLFNYSDLNDFVRDPSFDLFIVSEEGKQLFNQSAIQRDYFKILELYYFSFREFVSEVNNLNKYLKKTIQGNHFIVDAQGGIGKTHFSIGIFKTLKKSGHFPIFLKGSSFSGNSTDLNMLLKRIFEVSNSEQISNVFNLLDKYAKKSDKKVVLLIDGINETSYLSNGFSSVWNEGINWLVTEFAKYENLFLIVTSRTSYLNSINLSNIKNRVELQGFVDEFERKRIVSEYFKIYKIVCNLENSDLSHFQFPLFLSIFCQAVNGTRDKDVNIDLHQLELSSAMDKMIYQIASKASYEMGRPSPKPVLNGIDRNTIEFKNEISGRLKVDVFFESTDNKSIDEIFNSTSIAHHLLVDETLFLKELAFSDSIQLEYIIHTFQFIGGYLIAKQLLTEFPTSQSLVSSKYYINHLEGSFRDYDGKLINPNSHQSAHDILKFLVGEFFKKGDDILQFTNDYKVQNLNWQLLFENPEYIGKEALIDKLSPFLENSDGWNALLEQSLGYFLEVGSTINFDFVSERLKTLTQINSDFSWSAYVYANWYIFEDFLNDTNEMLPSIVSNRELHPEYKLRLEIVIWLLETNYRNGRDRATIILLEVGTKFPDFIFDKLLEFSNVNRLYIYERLACVAYGVCLRRQNDSAFIDVVFKDYITSIYNLQFGESPTAPTYHYVVIDCLKHLVDLALSKKIFELSGENVEDLNKYKFTKDGWAIPSGTTIATFQECGYNAYTHECPDPFRMDFVIYTVPRLVEYGNEVKKSEALANVYQRLKGAGYETLEFDPDIRSKMRDFFYGSSFYTIDGKIDRLGKKYSWNAFFEYAGYLIQQEQLSNIWSEYDKTSGRPTYERLGDVEFEVSNPKPEVISEQIYSGNLLDVKSEDEGWVNIEKHDVLWDIWKSTFERKEFTLLHGYIENKPDANYKVRSFLAIDSFLIKRSELEPIEGQLNNLIVDWKNELYGRKTISRTYFGELYWADNIPNVEPISNSIHLEAKRNVKRKLTIREIFRSEEYAGMKDGDIVEELINDQIHFNSEPTIADYLWESDRTSEAQDSYRDNIPSPQIGKYLDLRADAEKLRILDNKGEVASKTVDWETEGKDKQQMNFLRSDLLQKYMDDNDLVLLYEVRQFTHDQLVSPEKGQVDMRKIKYLLPHLKR